jgi:hypothetical protein
VKAYSIPVVKRTKTIKSRDVSGNIIKTQGLFTVPLKVSFGNDHSYDEDDYAFEVVKTSGDYDALTPGWDLEKNNARGMATSQLHFPPCPPECYGH